MGKKHTKLKSLSQGRPPTIKPQRSLSSKATRSLIRSHHTLEKQKAKAIAEGDDVKAASIATEIELQGGLEGYQRASLLGQDKARGGDSSRVLMDWIKPNVSDVKDLVSAGKGLKMLEVGALSTDNACSKSRLFEVERIDLNSQSEGIKQQDFMKKPTPTCEEEKFDIISLSLVLNYVPDAGGRGEMLARTLKFLKINDHSTELNGFFPSLFLVLPAPCVMNSRYMDEGRLEAIVESLGYTVTRKKISNKLVYYLLRLGMKREKRPVAFKKEEIRTGNSRNNFAIILK